MSASPSRCMADLTKGCALASAARSSGDRSTAAAPAARGVRRCFGTTRKSTFVNEWGAMTSSSAPSSASRRLMASTAWSASATQRSTRARMPSSPRAFHMSQSLNASGLRPHWIVLSPVSRSPFSLSGWNRYDAWAPFVPASAPSRSGLVTKTAHEIAAFMSLCGFTAMESAFSTPASHVAFSAGLQSAAPPQDPSTWCHTGSSQPSTTAWTSSRSSNAPRTVVPAVLPTKKGVLPAARASSMAFFSAGPRTRPPASTGTETRLSSPNPMIRDAFKYE
mmetsp:Transcript_29360/g.99799  ORF Transcript_29360/g.99799 Transcript_29360/m.99799 type:complete len:278 (-) Transcript_29360:647-1480(-)